MSPTRTLRQLAQFRYALRRFLRFSEQAARESGITPQQHQLMLGVAGFTGHGSATVSELAEFLQEQPHSVAGLVDRAAQRGLIVKTQGEEDRRVVNISLTVAGKKVLEQLSVLHRDEVQRIHALLGDIGRADLARAQRTRTLELS
jgi:DNA-binding MarR family transcriptional regulator